MPLLKFMVNSQQRRRLERQARVDKNGSPTYKLDFPATAAAAYVDYATKSLWPTSQKYAPLDWMEVVNNDVVDIDLTLNGKGGDTYFIPAGTSRTVETAFEFFRIKNLDSSTTSTLYAIRVTAQRKPIDADELARLEV